MSDRTFNVLFLCTGNSARSILAESIVNHLGGGRFKGFSAGSQPKGQVHPYAIDQLTSMDYPAANMHSKSWDVFAVAGAPHMDFVFTVCDRAAGEICPAWPGQPMTAHWGVPDPVAFIGTVEQQRELFKRIFRELDNRTKLFSSLRIEGLDRLALKTQLDHIGKTRIVETELPKTA